MSIDVQRPTSMPPALAGHVFFANFPEVTNIGHRVTYDNLTNAIAIILDIPAYGIWVMPFCRQDAPDVRWSAYVRSEYAASVDRYHAWFNEELQEIMCEVNAPSEEKETVKPS